MGATVSFGRPQARSICSLFSFCVWNQIPWRNLQIKELPRFFLHEPLLKFDGFSKFVMSWINFSERHLGSS